MSKLAPFRDPESLEKLNVKQLVAVAQDIYEQSYFALMDECRIGCNGKDLASIDMLETVAYTVGVDVKSIQDEYKAPTGSERQSNTAYRGVLCETTQKRLTKLVPQNWWREWLRFQVNRWGQRIFGNSRLAKLFAGVAGGALALAAFSAVGPAIVVAVQTISALGASVATLTAGQIAIATAVTAGTSHIVIGTSTHVHNVLTKSTRK
jgi:hypothetical protein